MSRVLFYGAAVVVVAVLVAAGYGMMSGSAPSSPFVLQNGKGEGEPVKAPKPKLGGPFTMVNQDGATVTDKDFLGRHMMVFFGYTYCPDVCPTALSTISDALDTLGDEKAGKVQPVFVSVDHARDTPDVLKQFVGHFRPGIVALTGNVEQTVTIARAYRAFYAKVQEENAAPDDYLIDHSAVVYLMGPDGKFVTSFSHGMPPEAMAEKLAEIL